MNVVCDTNVLISALLWQGITSNIFHLAKQGKINICASAETIDEFQAALSYSKFKKQLAIIRKTPEEVINEFLEVVAYYYPEKISKIIVKDDPSDDKFLACAIATQASFIVSGDAHLLKLKEFKGIPIVSPRKFLKIAKPLLDDKGQFPKN